MDRVFLLWHQHDVDDDDTAKLLGAYSSHERTARRIESARLLPGFRRYPDAFLIDPYVIDEDHWTSGFATLDVDGNVVGGFDA